MLLRIRNIIERNGRRFACLEPIELAAEVTIGMTIEILVVPPTADSFPPNGNPGPAPPLGSGASTGLAGGGAGASTGLAGGAGAGLAGGAGASTGLAGGAGASTGLAGGAGAGRVDSTMARSASGEIGSGVQGAPATTAGLLILGASSQTSNQTTSQRQSVRTAADVDVVG